MKKITIHFFSLILVIVFSNSMVWTVIAHGGEPRIELSAERLNPGATLEIRGVEFGPEEPVRLSLVGENYEHTLGETTTDVEGDFSMLILLPADLPEGSYYVRAVSEEHDLTSLALSVSGIAISNNEEGQRNEGEALLAAMPTFSPATPTPPDPVSKNQNDPDNSFTRNLWLAIVLGVGGIVLGSGLRVWFLSKGRKPKSA